VWVGDRREANPSLGCDVLCQCLLFG
jgi:hypothetical protein